MSKTVQHGAPAADEEQCFPRGGASTITPLKRRQIRAEAQADAERDFFAGTSAGAPASNKRQKKGVRATGAQVRSARCRPLCLLYIGTACFALFRQVAKDTAGPLSICRVLQNEEGSFLARQLASGKVPAFVELLKFKVSAFIAQVCSKLAARWLL